MEELDAILEAARKAALSKEQHRKLKAAVDTLAFLTSEIEDKSTTIARLRKMLFGKTTEKTAEVFPDGAKPGECEPARSDAAGRREGEGNGGEGGGGEPGTEEAQGEKKKRKGHGKNGHDAYGGAESIDVPHPSLKPGDPCPVTNCNGKVYRIKDPAVLVRIVGRAPLGATVYRLERLRCNLCLSIFTAKPPPGVGDKKYDESSAAMIALLKYGSGLPFNRLERLEGNLGIPLPAATQWEIVEEVALLLRPVYRAIIRAAAQGEVIHNDDTPAKILALMGERREKALAKGDITSGERTGLFTSGIISRVGELKIALFFTGRKHAGENLEDLLKERAPELKKVIQMCDALAANVTGDLKVILANCLAHARRQFVDVAPSFPAECRFVLEMLGEVYKVDAEARSEKMTPQERLRFHRERSWPHVKALRMWMRKQLTERLVEPNSGLGKAIVYMKRHWKKLTRFLHVPGAPLDNNVCERALKKAIIHRKNSLFFKTENGAQVGDIFMSLIHTCELSGENPFEYLTALQRHAGEMAAAPADWLPWSYRETMARTAAGNVASGSA
ncbi:MAG TPA: IS66 family transposase [Planctomycetota bacterium]|nr:IS66 family transposase [Planctomycetota bacterium]